MQRKPIKIQTCSPVCASLCGTHLGLLHAATEDGDGHSPLRPSLSPEGGGTVKEGGTKTMKGEGGEGEKQQKWGRNDDDNHYEAYNVDQSIRSNACIIARGLIHL